jgi:hypothetical protein
MAADAEGSRCSVDLAGISIRDGSSFLPEPAQSMVILLLARP